ncbi:MAG: FtsX-like permease family protein, partial [Gammaproteobacteria bacterium]
MRAINIKLYRELWQLKGQAFAIALVLASGVATYILSVSTLDSLRRTQATYYSDYRFADVFASLKRAPESLRARIESLPGVTTAQTRVVAQAKLDVFGFADPVNALLVSLPDSGPPALNAIYLHAGRLPEPGRGNETVVSEAFAEAHGLGPGDRLAAVINGRRESLEVVGIGSSPEYIYQIRPGDMFPDPVHYGVLWMRRNTLSAAYDMEGAFNDVALSVRGNVSVEHVIDGLNRLLERYGGARAYARKDQLSNRYLSQEMVGLETMARVFPVIFLGVAVFLLNVVTARLVGTQREQIGVLKAFGYGYAEIGWHYASMVLVIAVVGSIIGVAAGTWLGQGLTRLFVEFFHLPYLQFILRPGAAATAVGFAGGAALLGGSQSLRSAMRLPPAEAMQPAPPTRYRRTLVERMGGAKWLNEPTRMIARHINRHPFKALLTVLGIALSASILMVGSFQDDAIDYMMAVQFDRSAREDSTVTFTEPTSRRALLELRAWDGVLASEPFRAVPVRIRFAHRSYRTAIMGYEQDADLHRLLQTNLEPATLPDNGILLTQYLADWLGASPGDVLSVEVLTGAQRVSPVRLAGTVKEYSGVSGYMTLDALNRFML